jgi:hypothetical protein
MNLSVSFFSSKLLGTFLNSSDFICCFSWCHQTAYFSWGNQIGKIDNFLGMNF